MKIYFLGLALFISFYSSAQIKVGYYTDIDGVFNEGYYDALEYSPDDQLTIIHSFQDFGQGYLVDYNGQKRVGQIKFDNKKILFKEGEGSKEEKFSFKQLRSVVVGVDSFFTVNEFKTENRTGSLTKNYPELFQYIASFGGMVYAKHYDWSSTMAKTYQVRNSNESKWRSFPVIKKTFKVMALEYFHHVPYLKSQIESGQFENSDLETIIRIAEYQYKFENNEMIFFNEYWKEITNQSNVMYYAKIINKEDSIYTLDYYKDNLKIYTAQYSSFYPNRKNGMFTCYYPNGEIRKNTEYVNDKIKSVKTYYETGMQHYDFVMKKGWAKGHEILLPVFSTVQAPSGENLINETNNFIEELPFDNDKILFREFEKGKLLGAYLNDASGNKVYQINSNKYNLKLSKLQKRLNTFIIEKKYKNAIENDVEGTILILLDVDKNGYASYSILNKLHPEIDSIIDDFLLKTLSKRAVYRFKFRVNKIEKEKINFQMMIPLTFAINRFYRKPATYFNNNYFFMHQQMMMNMPINYINPPSGYGF